MFNAYDARACLLTMLSLKYFKLLYKYLYTAFNEAIK